MRHYPYYSYVGSTFKHLENQRKAQHKRAKELSRFHWYLQRLYKLDIKLEDVFDYQVLEIVEGSLDDVLKTEEHWIYKLDAFEHGFNGVTPTGSPCRGETKTSLGHAIWWTGKYNVCEFSALLYCRDRSKYEEWKRFVELDSLDDLLDGKDNVERIRYRDYLRLILSEFEEYIRNGINGDERLIQESYFAIFPWLKQ